jgi:hypothetical protein
MNDHCSHDGREWFLFCRESRYTWVDFILFFGTTTQFPERVDVLDVALGFFIFFWLFFGQRLDRRDFTTWPRGKR